MLVRSFFVDGGHQLQINALNRETLLDAQEHPELHRNLIVRVWGWSGYFVELDKKYQDQIIQRVEPSPDPGYVAPPISPSRADSKRSSQVKVSTRIGSGVLALALTLALASCSAEASTSEGKGGDVPVIGISLKTITNDPFQSAWVKAAEAKIAELGGKAEVLTAGSQTSVANQVSQLNDLVAKQVDGLIVNPIDGAAVIPALKKAAAANIPVVIVDSPVADGNDEYFETYIATDNVKAGSDLAAYLAESLGADAKVAIIEGAPGSIAGDDRKAGFLEGLKSGGITPVASASGEWSNDKALTAMENIITANPDLDGVLSASDVMIDGIFQALASAGKSDVKVGAIDGSTVGIQAVIDGKLLADNTQDPAAMGALAAENVFGLANGTIERGSMAKFVDSGTSTVTSKTAADALKTAF